MISNANFVRGLSGFALHKTEPIQAQNSGTWNGKGEGQQNLSQESLSHESFNGFPMSQRSNTGQETGLGAQLNPGTVRNNWDTGLASPGHLGSQEMSRLPSHDSIGAHSHRSTHSSSTANSYDQRRSMRLYHTVSQVPYHTSSASSDVTGRSNSPDNSAVYTPTQNMDLESFEDFPYAGADDLSGDHHSFHRGSYSGIALHSEDVSLTTEHPFGIFGHSTGDFMSLATDPDFLASSVPDPRDSIIYSPSGILDSPHLWDAGTGFLDSERSSPTLLEDPWAVPPHVITPATDSPLEYSPSLDGQSPTCLRDFPDLVELPPFATSGDPTKKRAVGSRTSKGASDVLPASGPKRHLGSSDSSDEHLKPVGRSSIDIDSTARDHHLYQNVSTKADGLYHCPWEGKPECQHKPEKLKCNYDKCVDSHLKPYRCKVTGCDNLHFSSTACLLRHEREAHGMHGHGDKPFLCTYTGCDRGSGNGFPRHWNLRDHMKRVHGDPGPSRSNASGSPPPPTGRGSRKRKGDPTHSSVQAKRVQTPPVIRQPKGPTLIDRYHESEQMLLETVKQLHDPKNAKNMTLLRNANDCIKVMAQTTQRINAPPTTWSWTSANDTDESTTQTEETKT